MILDKEIQVKIAYLNINHYKELGYDVKIHDIITIPVEHLSPQSNKRVNVKCDICGREKNIKYQSYALGTKFGKTYYACSEKCAQNKNKQTNLEKYGCEWSMQSKTVREKSKATCLIKYGVENISQSDYFKSKYKEIMLDRYGVENGFQLEEFKEKSKVTMIKKYGVPYNMQRQEMKELYCIGENNNFYIHGNYEPPDEWHTPEAKATKVRIIQRDNRLCACCKTPKRKIVIHHLYSRNTHKDLIYNDLNLILLCNDCHVEFHNKYGYGNNTLEQFIDFMETKSINVETIESISELKKYLDRSE